MNRYLCAIDAGTGSIRAIIFDTAGKQIAIAQYEWTHLAQEGVAGSMEFDFIHGWELAKQCINEAILKANISAHEIAAVSASSMREGIVVYDKDKNELW
ncbi:MAG: FGGY family carbohydrate kinase, partial [Sulfuricurvum sp.]|nr:FGGY family carbohydrate kinase [Sulfuricurvum sp.]